MKDGGPAWVRLSEACARLAAAGIGEADLLTTIAKAGLWNRIVASGFRSAVVGQWRTESAERLPVRRMTWRVFASPKARQAGFQRFIDGDDLIWNRGGHIEEFVQEAWRAVAVDSISFEALLRELAVQSPAARATAEETAAWVAAWPGTNLKAGWQAYRRHFGRRAGKRGDDFAPAWRCHHGNRSRGRPKKSPRGQ